MQNESTTVAYIRENNLLSEESLQDVLDEQESSGRSLMSILAESGKLSEDELAMMIAAGSGIEFISLSTDMIEPMAVHSVTYEMAAHHNVIPVRKEGDKLLVAMSSPMDLAVRDEIEMRTGCQVVPLAATPSAIATAIRYHFSVQNLTRQTIASMRLQSKGNADGVDSVDSSEVSVRNADDPITQLVSSVITGAIDIGASDIHIEPQEPDMRVRYRVDGLLRDAISVPSSVQQEVVSYIKVLGDMDISEKRLSQDGHAVLRHDGREYDLRISSLPCVSGEKVVIRILPRRGVRWSLDEIVTAGEDNDKFRSLLSNPHGMILLTGPTGSGKTTTLYSLLQILNTSDRNIVTVEDPVEYRVDGITQVQVKPAVGRTFASALRSILRQDPDVILVGEIRDNETAEMAVSAALTGHLVLSTLHTNDSAGAVSRLAHLGVPPFLIASSLLGVVAQRLIRTVCKECRQRYEASTENMRLLSSSLECEPVDLYLATGCKMCGQSGYRGRRAIYEIMNVSQPIRKMIAASAADGQIKSRAVDDGMMTLRMSALAQVRNGVTTLDEIQRLIDMSAA